jgi:hypothetical protein
MRPFLKHFAFVCALAAVLTYSLHLEHRDADTPNPLTSHCCLCYTAGMASPSLSTLIPSPLSFENPIVLLTERILDRELDSIDSPRGPPLA